MFVAGEEIVEQETTIPHLNATIGHTLGLPVEEVVVAPNGRPFKLADKGKPITALFA